MVQRMAVLKAVQKAATTAGSSELYLVVQMVDSSDVQWVAVRAAQKDY